MEKYQVGDFVYYIQGGEKYPATVLSITSNDPHTTVEIEFVAADPLGTGQQTLKLNKIKGKLEKREPREQAEASPAAAAAAGRRTRRSRRTRRKSRARKTRRSRK